ncbi:MAG: alpha-ketoglutarate-dependent dioxygenase AlkB [Hyphomicrobiaceae bacterium]
MGLPTGFCHLEGYFDAAGQAALIEDVLRVVAEAPFYRPAMPRSGKLLSVRMTNCGPLGWVTDKAEGYRYQAFHPETGAPWPIMPVALSRLWADLANYPAKAEACLINHYDAKARLGSHRDSDEADKQAPVLSVSLGDEAIFHVGGLRRGDPKQRLTLRSGDVAVLGGEARHAYHGIDRILPGSSSVVPFGGRINLTLRRVNLPA